MSLRSGWAPSRRVIDVAVDGISVTPFFCHAPNLFEHNEHEAVQHSNKEGAAVAFDLDVLVGFTRLDVDQGDAVLLCPLPECCADEVRPLSRRTPVGH